MAEGRAEGRTETLPHQVCPPWGGARSSSRLGATARPRTVVVVGGGGPTPSQPLSSSQGHLQGSRQGSGLAIPWMRAQAFAS